MKAINDEEGQSTQEEIDKTRKTIASCFGKLSNTNINNSFGLLETLPEAPHTLISLVDLVTDIAYKTSNFCQLFLFLSTNTHS